jgi:D-inositol-3-phosphate glycosyltransferase
LPKYQREIEKFSRQQQANYRLVHSNYWLSAVVGDQLQRRWGCPHLVTFHTLARAKILSRKDHQEERQRITEEERLLKCCDAVMVGTAAERNQLAASLGPAAAPIHLVPLGVDLDRFKPLPDESLTTGAKRRRHPLILFVGRFDPMKGVDTAVSAMARLDPQTEPEMLLVGGDGQDSMARKRLDGLVRQLQLQHRVRFAGGVDYQRIPEIYREADIVVVPSFYESFGLVVLEALASGIPVAATPTGVAAEIIVPGVNGYFGKAGDSRSMAWALAETLTLARTHDPQTIRKTAKLHDWSRVADSVVSVYSGVLSKR